MSVLDHLEKNFFTDEYIESLTNKIYYTYMENKTYIKDKIKVLEKEEQNISKQLDNIVDIIANTGILSDTLKEKLYKLEEQKN